MSIRGIQTRSKLDRLFCQSCHTCHGQLCRFGLSSLLPIQPILFVDLVLPLQSCQAVIQPIPHVCLAGQPVHHCTPFKFGDQRQQNSILPCTAYLLALDLVMNCETSYSVCVVFNDQ